ncbi:Tetratricopeptide repeat protein 16, partial [Globisporangium splendens]
MELTPEEAARAREEQADRHFAALELDAALHCLDKAIFLQPQRAPLYAKRAQVFWELCDLKSAMVSYRKLFSIDPTPPQRIKDQFAALLNLHGYSLLMQNEIPSIAITYLSEAIQLNGLEETNWLHRALAHIHANCFDEALKDIDHCICLNACDVEYFVLRAKLHWRLHMRDKATSDIQRAAMLLPDHPEVIEHEQRLLKESQAIYADACQHLLLRQYADVITCLNKAAEISPDETKFYMLRAAAYRELGEYHIALQDTDRAMSLHRRKLVLAQRKKQQKVPLAAGQQQSQDDGDVVIVDKSKEWCDIVTQRNLILTDLARRFLRGNSYQLALNALNQAIRGEAEVAEQLHEKVENPQQFINRGDAYCGLGNFQTALADYHHALEMLPGTQATKSRVGVIHYQFGVELFNKAQFEKAELEFCRAIAQDPSVAVYHVRKGDSQRYLEKHEAACTAYQSALELNPSDQDTKNKLLQYSVKPASTPSAKLGAASSRGNQRIETQTQSPRASSSPIATVAGVSSRPSARSEEEEQGARSLEKARRSYAKKNQVVKDLFLNRPVIPRPSKDNSSF